MSNDQDLPSQMQNRGGIEAPVSYWQASRTKIARNCNGCGTEGWLGMLVPDTMWGLKITEACDVHDWMYGEGTTLTDKKLADHVFLDNLIAIINGAAKSGPYRYFHWLLILPRERRAFKYYQAVSHSFSGESAFKVSKIL